MIEKKTEENQEVDNSQKVTTEEEKEEKKEEVVEIDKETQKSLVNEVKALREEKRLEKEAKEKLELELAEKIEKDKDDVTLKIEAILKKEREDKSIANKTKALESFISKHKEFHEGNDPAGIKMESLKKKIAMFNTGSLIETDDFLSVYNDAYKLLGGTIEGNSDKETNPYTSSNPNMAGEPSTIDVDKELSAKELSLVKSGTISKEKLLKAKQDNPTFIESLLEYVRN